MKRIFIFGLLVGITTGATAGNVIDGNPFYNPAQGRFYNVWTPIELNTKFEKFVVTDELGYGVSDDFAIHIATSGSYDSSDNPEFGKWAWNDLEFGFDWNLWDCDGQNAELYGDVTQVYNTKNHLETVAYNWQFGARVGRMADNWTVAGVLELDYLNDDLPHDTFDAWAMTVGVMGQYLLDSSWNLVGELMFDFDLFDDYYDGERLRVKFGVNYNLDATKYIGAYVAKDVVHSFDDAPVYFSLDFGIDF